LQTNMPQMRRKLTNRRVIVIGGLVILIIASLWWLVGQRPNEVLNTSTNWQQKEPLTYPYAVTNLENHQVILTEVTGQSEKVKLAVKCNVIGSTNFQLTVSSMKVDGQSASSTIGATGECLQVGTVASEQTVDLSQLHVGDRLFVTLTEPSSLANQPKEATSILLMGTDGRLRAGLFSVWHGPQVGATSRVAQAGKGTS